MKTLTDIQLVANYLKKSDEQALEELVQRYLPLIYGFARQYTGSPDHAADIAQETFVKAWKNLRRFDQAQSFRTWIFTIAKRTAIDWLKKKKALPFSLLEGEQQESFAESLVDDARSLIDQLSQAEESRMLATAIAQLPGHYRSVITLHTDHDLTFAQIAVRLREPLNTIKSRYRRGLALLKDILPN